MKTLLFTFLFLIFLSYWPLSFDWLYNDSIPSPSADTYGIVYGNKVELDWTPSKRLAARLDSGYRLYESKDIQKIIVSWWIGIEWFDEAVVMKEYLSQKWVWEDDIIVDSDGYTSRETSENAHELLWKDVTVVWISQWYHVARVKLSLKQAWFESVYWYAPKYFESRDVYSIMRELPAYVKYLF